MNNVDTILVIDTNQYAGNFERSLYKFLTCNDCDDVWDSSKMFEKYGGTIDPVLKDWWYNNLSYYRFDEEYGSQPVGMWITERNVLNSKAVGYMKYYSVGIPINKKESLTDDIKKLIKERVEEYSTLNVEKDLDILGYRIVEIKTIIEETTVDF